jgi:ABC-type Zn uptake system ZnuABC Zn-binding protein ZnuA
VAHTIPQALRPHSRPILMMLSSPAFPFSVRFIMSLALASAIGMTGGGCNKHDDAAAAAPARETMRVVATTYAMADIVRTVGGPRVHVEWWVESGDSLAELNETPERRLQLNSFDLVVTRGQVDPWTLAGVGNTYQDRRILRIDTLASARAHDPSHYIWLDPAVARELADELVTRLGAIDPSHGAEFRTNANAFQHEVDTMTAPVEGNIIRAGGGPFVTLDRGFLPLARRFGLIDVKIPRVNLSEPTSFNVKQLRLATQEQQGGAIFGSAETPVALLRDWEARLGIPVLALEPLGTSAKTGRSSTYLEMLRYNLAQLEKGVALSKPRERAEPGPLGAVIYEPPKYAPPPDDAATQPTTDETDKTSETPGPHYQPQSRPSVERMRFNLPLPTTTPTGPVRSPLLPPSYNPAGGK